VILICNFMAERELKKLLATGQADQGMIDVFQKAKALFLEKHATNKVCLLLFS
jgi:hypothetical protein